MYLRLYALLFFMLILSGIRAIQLFHGHTLPPEISEKLDQYWQDYKVTYFVKSELVLFIVILLLIFKKKYIYKNIIFIYLIHNMRVQ